MIFVRFRLSEEDGFPILLEYNQRCRPAWSEKELRHKMEDAIKKAAMTPYRIDLPSVNSFDFSDEDEQDATIRNWVPFPIDLMPDPLPVFVESSARSIGCDQALIVCPLLAGLAAAIGNCRVLRLKNDNGDPWEEPSILWTIAVAPPGTKKTAALNTVRKRFRQYEKQARHDNESELLEYTDAQYEYESQLKQYQKSKNGYDVSSPRPTRPDIPINNGIIVCDTTVEGLAARMRSSKKGPFLFRDELNAWFMSLGKYSKGGDSDTPFYLESHEGGVYSVTRKTTDSFTIERCSLSISGTIQPRVLSRFFKASDAMDSGFMQRFLFAMPPFKKAYWSSQGTDSAAIEGTQKVFDYLFLLPFSNAEHDPDVLKLSPEAQNLFIAEHDRLEDEKSNEKSDLLRGFLSKHCGKVARLAIVFH